MLILEFLSLLMVIVLGSWLLSYGAEIVAEKYGSNLAGSIILALITTLPEYMFVTWASLKGEYPMALGSAVGACTLLVTLGYGSVILLSTTRLSRRPVPQIELSRATQIDAIYLLITAVVAFILVWEGGGLDVKDGIILSVIFAAYVVHHYRAARHFVRQSEASVPGRRLAWAALLLVLGGALIVVLSERFVESMLEIAHAFGVSPLAVAIVLSPLASELPEKMTAYITVIRDARLAEISVCNFMGSKVNHNSLLLAFMPFIAAMRGEGQVPRLLGISFEWMTLLTVIAALSLARRKLQRWEGWVYLALYLATLGIAYAVR